MCINIRAKDLNRHLTKDLQTVNEQRKTCSPCHQGNANANSKAPSTPVRTAQIQTADHSTCC